MEEKNELVEQTEGQKQAESSVAAAKAQADALVAEAQAQADALVAKAQAQADAIVAQAQAETPAAEAQAQAEIPVAEETPMFNEEAHLHVVMEKEFLFDFFLYHAYSKAMGFLTNLCGFSFFIMGGLSYWFGLIDGKSCGFIVVCSILFLSSTPFQLNMKAKKAIKEPIYQHPLDYTFSDVNGITVENGDSVRNYSWDEMEKAVVAPKTIVIYLKQDNALVLPKVSFTKESFLIIYPMIERHLREKYHKMALAVRAKKEEEAKLKEKK